jgi:diguanylate cyclase (GGDEF)-like protein
LRSNGASAGIQLDASDLEALLAVLEARNMDELERSSARLRALLGQSASVLEPHIEVIRARQVELRQARYLAATDALTGLSNRRSFGEGVRRELSRSQRSGVPLAVVMIDIDDFKSINDTFGHATGDDVLKGVARCARNNTREGDLIARLGGDEFALLLPNADEAQAHAIGERVRADIASMRAHDTEPRTVGISIGISVARGSGMSVHALLAEADRNLYRDKAERKASGQVAEPLAAHSAA